MALQRIYLPGLALLVAAAVLLAPMAPSPLGFWLALAAGLIGPGLGVPQLLFPRGVLTLPETLFVTLLTSIFMLTLCLATLNALNVPLRPLIIGGVILGATFLSVAGGLARDYFASGHSAANPPDQPSWLAFGCGVMIAAAVTGSLIHLIGR